MKKIINSMRLAMSPEARRRHEEEQVRLMLEAIREKAERNMGQTEKVADYGEATHRGDRDVLDPSVGRMIEVKEDPTDEHTFREMLEDYHSSGEDDKNMMEIEELCDESVVVEIEPDDAAAYLYLAGLNKTR